MMQNYIAFDMIIKEDDCNLNCEYCLTGQSWFTEEHLMQNIFSPPTVHSCVKGSPLYEKLSLIIEKVASRNIPVIKISGGEVFMIKGFLDFLEMKVAPLFETVVVLTNGILINSRRLDRLQNIKNLVIQLSLDAMNFVGNSYRISNLRVYHKFMKRLYPLLNSGIPIEIYAVLNDRSIDHIEDTVRKLQPYSENIALYPFPVRGPNRAKYLPRPDQIHKVEWLIKNRDRYIEMLPSMAYLERLLLFFKEAKRTFRCHLPRIAFTAFENGTTTSCPNIWFNKVSNLLEQSTSEVFTKLSDSTFRELLLAKRPKLEACQHCYTPWDSVTLYFEDKITLEELSRCPIYRGRHTLRKLREEKENFRALCVSQS